MEHALTTPDPHAPDGSASSAVTGLPPALARLAAPPIFVIGKARSGTTWVYDILTEHPEVAGVFESWMFTDVTGLGALLRERNWSKEHSGLRQLLTREEMIEDVRELAARWLARAMEPEHRFVAEKSPGLHLATLTTIFPEARVVHCLRDGRDVAVSMHAAARSWAPEWRNRMARSTYASAKSWRGTLEELRRAQADLGPERFLEIRYEQLKAEPEAGIGRLFDFCGIPYDADLLQKIVDATDFDKVHAGGEDQFRRGGRVGDWQSRFGPIDALMFDLGGGKTLVDEGYERNRRWWLRHALRRSGADHSTPPA